MDVRLLEIRIVGITVLAAFILLMITGICLPLLISGEMPLYIIVGLSMIIIVGCPLGLFYLLQYLILTKFKVKQDEKK